MSSALPEPGELSGVDGENITRGQAAIHRADALADPVHPPGKAYSERLRDALREAERLEKRSALLANLRGAAFIAIAAVAALILFGKLPRVAWYAVATGAALYGAVATVQDRVLNDKRRSELRARLNERGVARLTGEWHRFRERGNQFRQPDHFYAEDLDIFGQGSVFQLINETATRLGESVLAQWLSSAAPVSTVRQRQGAVRELASRLDFRQQILVECSLVTEEKLDPRQFISWAEGGPYLTSISWVRPLAWLIPTVIVLLFALGQWSWIPPYGWLAGILVSIFTIRLVRSHLEDFYNRIAIGETGFMRFARVFQRIESEDFRDPLLRRLSTDLSGERVSMHMTRFARLFSFAELRQNKMVHAVIDTLTLWDVHWFFRLERWRKEVGAGVRRWFDALAELEALCSLSTLAHDRPQYTFPEFREESPLLIARALGHPLLDNPIRNDVEIPGPGHALVITGSNMSGKSTMLRAMGTNAVLALAGAPVCAEAMVISELQVLTSMRVRDSLELGVSYFYAEVKRIKAILDVAAALKGRALFLLDEILWGTNTRERRIASRAVLRLLLDTGASGAVSTHDLSLASLEQELGSLVKNYHFKDLLVDGQMSFDYRLRPGVLDSTNALRVLRQVGIEIKDETTPAQEP